MMNRNDGNPVHAQNWRCALQTKWLCYQGKDYVVYFLHYTAQGLRRDYANQNFFVYFSDKSRRPGARLSNEYIRRGRRKFLFQTISPVRKELIRFLAATGARSHYKPQKRQGTSFNSAITGACVARGKHTSKRVTVRFVGSVEISAFM